MAATAAPPAPRTKRDVDALLADSRERVRRTLERLPENRLEARRRITRELGFDPSAEELHSVVRLAHDPAASDGSAELGRRALAVRRLADGELLDVFDAPRLDPDKLADSAGVIPGLLAEVTRLECELRGAADAAGDAERDFLLQVLGTLLPAREPLLTAVVLFPPLLLLARAADDDDPRRRIPSLHDEDLPLLTPAAPAGEADPRRSSRACVNAIALRIIISKDLEAWEAVTGDATAGISNGGLRRLLERLERERTAYRVVSDRLQQQQDTALMAGLSEFSEQLRGVKQNLFSMFLKLAAVLKDPAGSMVEPADHDEAAPHAELDRLLARCSEGDAAVEARRSERISDDELYLSALKGLGQAEETSADDPGSVPDGADLLRRERRRLRLLGAVAALLLTICFSLPFLLHFGGAREPRIDVEQLPTRLIPIQSIAVGPMMYVQISSWTWGDLDEAERVARVEELGQAARQRGLDTVYVTDEDDHDLARWSRSEGVRLYDFEP